MIVLVSLHLQDSQQGTSPAALLSAVPVGEIQASAFELDSHLMPTASGNRSSTVEDCPRISSYL